MDSGLFQLVFIGLIVLASVFDATTRKRRRQQRMEQSERAEEKTKYGGERAEAGRTADSMIPADLWEVLTGEKRTPERAPEPEPEPAPTPEAEPAWRVEPGSYEPYVPPPYVELPAEETPEAPPVPEVTAVPEAVVVPEAAADPWFEARPRSVPSSVPPRSGETLAAGSVPGRPTSGPKGRTAAAAYAALLRSGGQGSLRTAIVMSEVLGAPVALRRGDDPDGRAR